MAQDLPKLLLSKNRCLERFLALSEDFLRKADSGALDGLDAFHAERESILKGLELYDRKIGKLATEAPEEGDSRRILVDSILPILAERDKILARIARCDEEIIKKVEAERERITREMNAARKAQSHLSKFKSAWVSDSGEELDQKL